MLSFYPHTYPLCALHSFLYTRAFIRYHHTAVSGLSTNYLSFSLPEMFLVLMFEGCFSTCRILGWQIFFQHFDNVPCVWPPHIWWAVHCSSRLCSPVGHASSKLAATRHEEILLLLSPWEEFSISSLVSDVFFIVFIVLLKSRWWFTLSTFLLDLLSYLFWLFLILYLIIWTSGLLLGCVYWVFFLLSVTSYWFFNILLSFILCWLL